MAQAELPQLCNLRFRCICITSVYSEEVMSGGGVGVCAGMGRYVSTMGSSRVRRLADAATALP